MSKVQAVIYMTRSINESENENVVGKGVEQTNLIQQRKFPWRVVPPVLPFSGTDIEKSIGITGKFIKFAPSERNSGCFVAVITREVTHPRIVFYVKSYFPFLNFMPCAVQCKPYFSKL